MIPVHNDNDFATSSIAPGGLPAVWLSDVERANVYQWFAGLFAHELSAEALSIYKSADGELLLDGLATYPWLAPVVDHLKAMIAHSDALEPLALDLAGDFARLFLGVAGRHSAPPYESAYNSATGLLFQEPTDHMRSLLADLDLHVDEAFPEPPDHLSIQLLAFATMIQRANLTGCAKYADRKAQRAFLEQRLLSWLVDFRDACANSHRSGFYAVAADSLVSFVAADFDAIGRAPD